MIWASKEVKNKVRINNKPWPKPIRLTGKPRLESDEKTTADSMHYFSCNLLPSSTLLTLISFSIFLTWLKKLRYWTIRRAAYADTIAKPPLHVLLINACAIKKPLLEGASFSLAAMLYSVIWDCMELSASYRTSSFEIRDSIEVSAKSMLCSYSLGFLLWYCIDSL